MSWVEQYGRELIQLARGNYGKCPECKTPLTKEDLANQIDAETQARAELCIKCWKKISLVHDLREVVPDRFFKMTTCCSSKRFHEWEQDVTAYLQQKGFTVGEWFTEDGDSFGPLVRGVIINNERYSYG